MEITRKTFSASRAAWVLLRTQIRSACYSAGFVSFMRRRRATAGTRRAWIQTAPIGSRPAEMDWHGSITPSFGGPGTRTQHAGRAGMRMAKTTVRLPIYTRISTCSACSWRAGGSWGRP